MPLRITLADLYPDEGNQRRIVSELGIEYYIDLSGPPIVVWSAIVRVARQRGKLAALVATVLAEYGMNSELRAAVEEELRRPPAMSVDDEMGRGGGNTSAIIALLNSRFSALEAQIAAVQKENVDRRHELSSAIQNLMVDVGALATKLNAVEGKVASIEGTLRNFTPEGRAEAHVRAGDIRQAFLLAAGFVALLLALLIASRMVPGAF